MLFALWGVHMYVVIIDADGSLCLNLESFIAAQGGYKLVLSTGNIEEALNLVSGNLPRIVIIDTDQPRDTRFPAIEASKDLIPPSSKTLLSSRETEILELLNQGCTKESVADKLCLSYHTVKTHTTNIYRKLNVHSCREAIFKIFREGR